MCSGIEEVKLYRTIYKHIVLFQQKLHINFLLIQVLLLNTIIFGRLNHTIFGSLETLAIC